MQKFPWLGIFLFLVFVSKVFGQVGDPLIGEKARRRLAEAWAPTAFVDVATEFSQPETGFNPVDDLVGLFYDDNQDLRDNSENIFKLGISEIEKIKMGAPVYYSVIETETHYYINYIFYHALDAGGRRHTHDTENLWTVLEKDGSPSGRLLFQITNAHGLGMIYGRATSLKFRDLHEDERKFLPFLDLRSTDHHVNGLPEYIQRQNSESFKIFISSKTHAIYKFKSEAWRSDLGVVYVPATCEPCFSEALQYCGRVRSYQLVDWDSMLETNLIHSQMGESERREFFKIFINFSSEENLSNPLYRTRAVPEYLTPGFSEETPEANLFQFTSFHSPHQLSDPASVHRYFAKTDRAISNKYIFNPYLNETHPKKGDPRFARFIQPLRRGSLFHFATELWAAD